MCDHVFDWDEPLRITHYVLWFFIDSVFSCIQIFNWLRFVFAKRGKAKKRIQNPPINKVINSKTPYMFMYKNKSWLMYFAMDHLLGEKKKKKKKSLIGVAWHRQISSDIFSTNRMISRKQWNAIYEIISMITLKHDSWRRSSSIHNARESLPFHHSM